jgi:heptosyltransferase III
MKSALFIRGGAIGDFILTLPGIHAFRDHYPQARVEILGYPHIACLAENRFYANTVHSLNRRAVAGFFARKGDLDPDLSKHLRSFDVIVSFLYDPDQMFSANLERAGVRKMIHVDCHPTGSVHASDALAKFLPKLGILKDIQPPKIYSSPEDQRKAEEFLGTRRSVVALHIGSGSPSKNWPLSSYLELTQHLKTQGFEVLIVYGPAEMETASEFWTHPIASTCLRAEGLDLPTLAAIFQKCIAFVGNDSGICHLSAAMGTPTIAIFGPSNPKVWGPRGNQVTVLQGTGTTSSIPLEKVKTALAPHLQKRES